MSIPSTLTRQVGGNHYRKYKIQPLEFTEKLGLTPIIFCIFKYVCRYKDKNRLEDLSKALHCIDVFSEIGVTKDIKAEPTYLVTFLDQFENKQSETLHSILKLQSDKAYIDEVKNNILFLKECLMYE